MSMGQFIVGVLSALPGKNRLAIFIDVYKSYTKINKLINDNSSYYRFVYLVKKLGTIQNLTVRQLIVT